MLKWIVLAIPLAIIIALAVMSYLTRENPISTQSNPQLQPCPGTPNCVSSLARDTDFFIEPLSLSKNNPDHSWQRIAEIVVSLGGEIVRQDERYLHAVFTSSVFRFRDDLELVLEQDYIDVRSASRAGKSDLGKNRERVEKLRATFAAR